MRFWPRVVPLVCSSMNYLFPLIIMASISHATHLSFIFFSGGPHNYSPPDQQPISWTSGLLNWDVFFILSSLSFFPLICHHHLGVHLMGQKKHASNTWKEYIIRGLALINFQFLWWKMVISVPGSLCPEWGNLSIIGLLNQLEGDVISCSFRKFQWDSN